jgi:hypothetical protein
MNNEVCVRERERERERQRDREIERERAIFDAKMETEKFKCKENRHSTQSLLVVGIDSFNVILSFSLFLTIVY